MSLLSIFKELKLFIRFLRLDFNKKGEYEKWVKDIRKFYKGKVL